ncbi:MAG TPA: sulfurtransferase [Pyrinomonadaceae bacterium]|nr:sulfurtransferase [Pyrinomonadaceae bacterium]
MRSVLLTIFAIIFVSLPAVAQAPMVVSADWLKENIKDPKIVLLHVGQKAEYDAGHIAGAVYATLDGISAPRVPDGLALELPSAEQLKATLEKSGISNDSRIIIYFGKDWFSPTSRVYYTLDVFGLAGNASLLDGGMPAWVAAGGELSKEVPSPRTGSIKVERNDKLVANADWLKSNLKNDKIKIIDARDPEFYDGSSAGGQPRAGHITGARSIPFTLFTDDKMKLKDETTLRKIFTDAGVKPGDEVVTYCHIGQQGTAPYFVAKKLGYKVALYDGSYQEWSRLKDAPVENPAGDRPATSVSLVTPQWVEEHASDPNVRVIDVRQNVYEYFTGHVPNAVHLADSAMRFPFEGNPTQYPELFMISQLFSRAGVKKTDRVVLYSDGDNVLGATMLAYLLEKIGHSDIAIVDGGWKDYSATQKAVQEYPQYKPAPYDVLDNRSGRAALDDVKPLVGKDTVKFIDARPPNVYRGEAKIWIRNGHIPGAYNIPWKTLVDETNTHKLKSIADLKAAYAAKGIGNTDDIIVYCGTSREASIEYFVLKHLLKFPKVRLYEGSWAEYANQPALPIETGAGK